MSKTTEMLTMRTDAETKTAFRELAEQSGLDNHSEFLERLLVMWSAQTSKKTAVLKPAIETVEELSTRLLGVLNGAAIAIEVDEEKRDAEIATEKENHAETKELLRACIEERDQLAEECSRLVGEYNQLAKELAGERSKMAALEDLGKRLALIETSIATNAPATKKDKNA